MNKKIKKVKTIKAYMTFRGSDNDLLRESILSDSIYKVYDKHAPSYQKDDKSIEVTITYPINSN